MTATCRAIPPPSWLTTRSTRGCTCDRAAGSSADRDRVLRPGAAAGAGDAVLERGDAAGRRERGDRMKITVRGIPAPQGSKRHVGGGRMIEMSKAVGPWREAV